MDTSVEGSDISLSDFTESKKVTRKRKRNIPPLRFQEDPLDVTFYSPERPLAVPNPIGAPAVDVLGQTNTWISVDEFGQMTATRRLPRRRPTRGNNDIITCSRADCAHPLHVHNRDMGKRRINISDNDSDLLISIDDTKSQKEVKGIDQKDISCDKAPLNEEKENILSNSYSSYLDSGIGKFTQKGPCEASENKLNSSELQTDSHVKSKKTADISVTSCSNQTDVSQNMTPTLHSPSFHRVGFSQCKPGKSVKKTRQIPDTESYPDPVYVEKEDLRRRVVFESPRTPMKTGMVRKNSDKILETPENGRSEVLVEDTPEHLIGMRMVTRRLRRVLKQTIPDSLNF